MPILVAGLGAEINSDKSQVEKPICKQPDSSLDLAVLSFRRAPPRSFDRTAKHVPWLPGIQAWALRVSCGPCGPCGPCGSCESCGQERWVQATGSASRAETGRLALALRGQQAPFNDRGIPLKIRVSAFVQFVRTPVRHRLARRCNRARCRRSYDSVYLDQRPWHA